MQSWQRGVLPRSEERRPTVFVGCFGRAYAAGAQWAYAGGGAEEREGVCLEDGEQAPRGR